MPQSLLRFKIIGSVFAAFLGGCGVSESAGPLPSGLGEVESLLISSGSGAGPVQMQSSGPGQKPRVTEIIVTVAKVTAHSSTAGWVTLSSTEVTVDLLKLSSLAGPLGLTRLPPGKVTQVRLYLAEGGTQYVTREDGVRMDLKVPSGLQSGIKLKGLFDIGACERTTLNLDIDSKRSIWVHPTGQTDLWILRPVIRIGKIASTPVGCVPGGAGGGSGSTGAGGGGVFTEGPGAGTNPPMGGTGSPCGTNLGCLSGSCLVGVCATGGPDAPCKVAADCASLACVAGTCTVGSAGGTGAACTLSSQCLSNACVAGKCGEGGQGQPCQATADCAQGFSCSAGTCTSTIN